MYGRAVLFSDLSLCLEICLEWLRKRRVIVSVLLSFVSIFEVRITRIQNSLLGVGEVTDVNFA